MGIASVLTYIYPIVISGTGMRIYFCGSMQGGREDAELYSSIIDELKSKYGQVLTEYVGSSTAVQGKYCMLDGV